MKNHLLLVLLCAGPAGAATVVQTQAFTINESSTAVTGPTVVFDSDYLASSVNPFDAGLGTLQSFTLTWTLSGTFSGTIAQPGGGASATYSGNFLIQSLTFPTTVNGSGSGGGGAGSGGPGGMVVSLPFTTTGNPLSFSRTFLVGESGTDYDAGILAAVQGGAPVVLEWDTALTINGNYDDLTVTGNGSVELVYNYAAVPEPSAAFLGLAAMGVIGLRRWRR